MDIPSITAIRLAIKAIEDAAGRKTLCLTALRQLFPDSVDKTDLEELQNEQFDLLSVAMHLRKQLKLRGFVDLPVKSAAADPHRAKKEITEVGVRIRPTKAATRRGGIILIPQTVMFTGEDVRTRQGWSNIQWAHLALNRLGEERGLEFNHTDYIATVQRS